MAEDNTPNTQEEKKSAEKDAPESKTAKPANDKPVAKKKEQPLEKKPVAEDAPEGKTTKPAAADKPAAKKKPLEKKLATKDAPESKTTKPAADKPAAKKKPPAIEKKPFAEFIQTHYLPGLTKAFEKQGVNDLTLTFEDNEVSGVWQNGDRQFTVYFLERDIKKKKAFTCSTKNAPAAIIESFLIDERKVTLELLVFGVVQRINAQKWFGSNTLSAMCN